MGPLPPSALRFVIYRIYAQPIKLHVFIFKLNAIHRRAVYSAVGFTHRSQSMKKIRPENGLIMADIVPWVKRSNASTLRLLCFFYVFWILRFQPGHLMPFMWNSSDSAPSRSEKLPPSIYLRQTDSLNLPKTLLEAVEDVKAADLLCSCLAAWHPKGLNTALAINRRNF